MQTSGSSILVFGPSYIDNITYVDQILLDGSTKALGKESYPGGTGFCYALALKQLGANVTLATALGNDAKGEAVRKKLEENSLDAIIQTVGETDSAQLFITPDGGKFVVSDRNASNLYSLTDKEKDAIRAYDVIAVTSFSNNLAGEIFRHARDKFVVFSPNMANCNSIDEIGHAMQHVDYLNMNQHEYEALSHQVSPDEISGRKYLTVTKNGHGASLYHRSKHYPFQCFPETVTHVVNSKGAGESFCSGFLHYLLREECMFKAMKHGLASGYLKVQRKGIDYPKAKEVEGVVERNRLLLEV